MYFPDPPISSASCVPTEPHLKSASGAPESYTPPRIAVPIFPPIRAGGRGGGRLGAALRRRRRHVATGLAVVAAVVAVSSAHGSSPRRDRTAPRAAASTSPTATATHTIPAQRLVKAPVRIADPEAVALLHPGARVDVLAGARVVASSVAVVSVPPSSVRPQQAGPQAPENAGASGGALIVLAVPRRTAAALSGAAATSPLGVALC